MFFPGESICHMFVVPFVPAEISKAIISYKQDEDIVFEKTITQNDTDERGERLIQEIFDEEQYKSVIYCIVSPQLQSLLFKDDSGLKIQVNIFTTNGRRATSQIIKSYTGEQFYREVISNA